MKVIVKAIVMIALIVPLVYIHAISTEDNDDQDVTATAHLSSPSQPGRKQRKKVDKTFECYFTVVDSVAACHDDINDIVDPEVLHQRIDHCLEQASEQTEMISTSPHKARLLQNAREVCHHTCRWPVGRALGNHHRTGYEQVKTKCKACFANQVCKGMIF